MSMRKSCIECGLPTKIYEKGKLFIEFRNNIDEPFLHYLIEKKILFNRQAPYLSITYDDKEHLKFIITLIQQHPHATDKKGGVVRFSDKISYLNMIPLEQLYEQIANERIVSFIKSGEFVSFLQPIINLKDNASLYGYESLLRSADPTQAIYPNELFEVANKSGLKSLLDQRAREIAVKTRVNQIQTGIKSFINFLPSTIYNPEFCLKHTFSIVEKYQVSPDDLVFEVVETEKIIDFAHLKKILMTYKANGMKVALDDVGSGYATLEMLTALKPDYVKIDRSYISFCDQDTGKQQFLNKVLHITKNLGIKVLGEGIEREEELIYCQDIGMDLAQGYFIGRPSPNPVENIVL